jgi:putative PLP-dependent aminotransferase (TIGR04422 family)
MEPKLFLWPAPRFLRRGISSWRWISSNEFEKKLQALFPGGFPVLVSSGRVGLVLALTVAGLKRENHVGIFPFASHCVIEAVGRVATPLPGPFALSSEYRVVYHQWSVVQETPAKNIFIEDAVDTLCEPGTSLFPSGGQVEVWSLPKLFGSLGGGVVWCETAELATLIRSLRDDRKAGTRLRWAMRLAATKMPSLVPFWYGPESLGGPMPFWAIGEVATSIDDWSRFVDDRRQKLAMVLPFAPVWFKLIQGRLPPVVPVIVNEDIAAQLVRGGLSYGFRTFERISTEERTFERVFPIPIHQDITIERLERFISLLAQKPA